MTKILLKGIDWLQVNVDFEGEKGRNKFQRITENFIGLEPKSKVNFLGRNWIKFIDKKEPNKRYELISEAGLYLSIATYSNTGDGHTLRISLQKPLDRSKGCLLWEDPFNTMKTFLNQISSEYGEISYSIARVDLFTHFTKFDIKLTSMPKFKGLPRGPWQPDQKFTGFSFGHKRPSVKRVSASIYQVGARLEDKPKSFDPSPYYKEKVDLDKTWNVEFKIYRKFLEERQIYSLNDLERNLTNLWKDLTHRKVRMIVQSKTDTNPSRQKTNRKWKKLQNAFGDKFEPLIRYKENVQKQPPKEAIKRIETSLCKLAIDLELWHLTPEERIQSLMGYLDIKRFEDEEMIKYMHEEIN